MKNAARIGLLVGAALIVLGIVLFGLVMSLNHWDFSRLDTTSYETDVVEIGKDFENLSFRFDTSDLSFLPSDDGGCKVVFHEPAQWRHTAEVKGDTLAVEVVDARRWYESFGAIHLESPSITVYLPRSEYGALTLEEDTGDVTLPADFRFSRVDLTCSTGDVRCAASVSEQLRIRRSTGDVTLADLTVGELELSGSTGTTTLTNVDCAGALNLTASTGKAVLTNVTCGELTSRADTGDIQLEQVRVSGAMTLTRSTGDVRFEKCDAGALTIRTDTGRVSGTLLSEKVFITKTSTGKVNVPDTASGGRCEITTDTGNIDVTLQ